LVELVGPWSDPSDPVYIPEDTVFFVTGSRNDKGTCKMDIFKWYRGEWLRKTANDVQVGQRIGDVARVEIPPTGERVEVNFDTGAIVVDIDFARPYRMPARQPGKRGSVENTTALVYLDSSGQLREQLLDFDKVCESYNKMKNLAWKPAR
jgi:hypothetical protein